ncbi:hypothetical protein [Geodermatophilus amargosae]|uniref:hypothetical protein n=1 Tax=Geodermatophilus amargosae TaxID=1296565 RepID=UPI001114FCB1|nr:hypothetical protein [Geodermatophilus amargosae]
MIFGASDTGKSFIVSAIDYTLGAARLKDIPEAQGYTHSLVSLDLPNGENVTLARPLRGGRIAVYEGDWRSLPPSLPRQTLADRKPKKGEESISDFLLRGLGLEGRKVIKNSKGATQSLSFRNLAHLCIVNEAQMQSEVPPALTGQHVSRTAERSALRVLLQNDDDGEIAQEVPTDDEVRIGRSKQEVLAQLHSDLVGRMQSKESRVEVEQRLGRLSMAIAGTTDDIEGMLRRRQDIVEALQRATTLLDVRRRERLERQELGARFSLLASQYESDLGRLELVREAGTLLGYFDTGVCAFCGASPEHQKLSEHLGGEATQLDLVTRAEESRINMLRTDLAQVQEELATEVAGLVKREERLRDHIESLRVRIRDLDRQLSPLRTDLPRLLEARSVAERLIAYHEQLASIEALLRANEVPGLAKQPPMRELSPVTIREFEARLRDTLTSWGVTGSSELVFNPASTDLVIAGQSRADRGKGMRAILHACFTLGLADYCNSEGLPHPGFVVLDSPVVTYRPPDENSPWTAATDADDDEYVSATVFDRFYEHLATDARAQVIVMENVSPPNLRQDDSTRVHHFTKNDGVGRYGFFPHEAES